MNGVRLFRFCQTRLLRPLGLAQRSMASVFSTDVTDKLPVLPLTKELPDKSGIETIIGGYSYDDIDREGNVCVWKVARLTEGVRYQHYKMPLLPDPDQDQPWRMELLKNQYIFTVATSTQIMPAFYNSFNLNKLLRSTDRFANLGKSSYQHINETYSTHSGELLHRCISFMVSVDGQTRKPAPIPKNVQDFLQGRVVQYNVDRVQLLKKPEDAVVLPYTIRWSDTDFFHHANQAAYLRFCYDAMTEACLGGRFRLKGDLADYWVKEAKVSYLAENLPRDRLQIHLWEDTHTPYILHAVMEKESREVFQCSMEFYTISESKM